MSTAVGEAVGSHAYAGFVSHEHINPTYNLIWSIEEQKLRRFDVDGLEAVRWAPTARRAQFMLYMPISYRAPALISLFAPLNPPFLIWLLNQGWDHRGLLDPRRTWRMAPAAAIKQ